ncbi:MAG: tetratricopeptide repeat protein [Verrucomicrobiota bacterium]
MGDRDDFSFELSFYECIHKRMPKDVRVASILAHLYTKTGRLDSGLKMDRKLVRLTPDDPTAHYNLACSLSLKGRYNDAIKVLREAITLGYADFNWMRNDPDLADLQDKPKFSELLSELGIG